MLALGVNGQQKDQSFLVTDTDASTTTFTRTLNDWHFQPSQYEQGEFAEFFTAYRLNVGGTTHYPTSTNPYDGHMVYEYRIDPDPVKIVSSVTLPDNRNVVVLSLSEALFTNTRPVT